MALAKTLRIASDDCHRPDRDNVIVTPGVTPHIVQVHHRDVPDLQSDGETARSAAVGLEQDYAREIDGLIDQSRRETFVRALADVREFITSSH